MNLSAETFRNCADIAITSNTGGIPPLFVGRRNPFLLYYRDYRAPEDENIFPLIIRFVSFNIFSKYVFRGKEKNLPVKLKCKEI